LNAKMNLFYNRNVAAELSVEDAHDSATVVPPSTAKTPWLAVVACFVSGATAGIVGLTLASDGGMAVTEHRRLEDADPWEWSNGKIRKRLKRGKNKTDENAEKIGVLEEELRQLSRIVNPLPILGCAFPTELSEPSLTDIHVGDNSTWVWENNPLCTGWDWVNSTSNCDDDSRVGGAFGVATDLGTEDEVFDSVDTWFLDGYGSLISRGVTGGDHSISDEAGVVLGGTGCFKNAGGTVGSSLLVDNNDVYWYQYDLSNVILSSVGRAP